MGYYFLQKLTLLHFQPMEFLSLNYNRQLGFTQLSPQNNALLDGRIKMSHR